MSDLFNHLEQPVNLLDMQAFEANQRGEITAVQQQQLGSLMGWKSVFLLTLATIILGSILGFALFPVIFGGRWYANLLPVVLVAGIFLAFMLYMGFGISMQLRKNARLRRDFTNRAIRQGQGQLSHGKKGYVFEMSGVILHLPANLASGLLPGVTYQVYYLEESGFLLSATASYPSAPAQTQAALNEILAAANHFSADDLAANRNGEVTFAQRQKLFPSIIGSIAIVLGLMVILLPFIFLSAFSDFTMSFGALLFVILVVSILPVLGGIMLIKALRDAIAPKPQQVQGVAHLEKRIISTGKSSRIEYYYTINNQRFTVDYRAYTALIDGLQYRIYYLPRSKKLISIEALDALHSGTHF